MSLAFPSLKKWMFFLPLFLCACQSLDSPTLIRAENYSEYQDNNVSVFTKDGREIQFDAGHHHLTTRNDSTFVAGAGVLYSANGVFIGRQFTGEIPESQIERVELRHHSSILRFGMILLALCIVVPLGYAGFH